MRNRSLILLLLTILFIGCAHRPKGVMSKKQMVDVLVDIHLVDGGLQATNRHYADKSETAAYYTAALNKHGITQAQFDSSLVWYTDHPKRFNKIYPVVIRRLQAISDDYDALNADAPIELEPIAEEQEQTPAIQLSDEDWINITLHGLNNPWQLQAEEPYSLFIIQ